MSLNSMYSKNINVKKVQKNKQHSYKIKRNYKSKHKKKYDQNIVEIEPGLTSFQPIDEVKEHNCRICLKDGSIPIFTSDNKSFIDEIKVFGAIDIKYEDDFPKYLCEECNLHLQSAILFRSTAQQTDKILRETKGMSKVKIEHEDVQLTEDLDTSTNLLNETLPKAPQNVNLSTEKQNMYTGAVNDDIKTDPKLEPNDDGLHENNLLSMTEINWDSDDQDGTSKKTNGPAFCTRCQIKFETQSEYREHRASEQHRAARVQCASCGASVAGVYLRVHVAKYHTEAHAYLCDVCGKPFAVLAAFKQHRITHTDELPYKCDSCPYRGRLKESLRLHMRVHTGERPYACAQCPARFINKSNLNKHALTHQRDFVLKCPECDRGFHYNSQLKEHLRVDHTGLREHVCDICGKDFAYRKQMMKHQIKVHNRARLRSGRMPTYLLLQSQQQGTDAPARPAPTTNT